MLDLSEIRKKFHQRPETSWTEFWTTAEICKYLEEFGYNLMVGKELYKIDLRKLVPKEEIIDKWYQKKDVHPSMDAHENYVRHPFGQLGSDDVIFLMNKVKKNGGKAIYIGLVSDNDSGKIRNIHAKNFDFKDDLLYGGVNLITKMIEKLNN